MDLVLPEELTQSETHFICCAIKEKHPKIFAELVDVKFMAASQKFKILDNLLMEHPDLYCQFFDQEEPER